MAMISMPRRQPRILADGEPAEPSGRSDQDLAGLAQPRVGGNSSGRGCAVQRDRFRAKGFGDAKDLEAAGAVAIRHEAKAGSFHIDYCPNRVHRLGQAFAGMNQIDVIAA